MLIIKNSICAFSIVDYKGVSSFEKRKKRTIVSETNIFKAEFVFKNKNHIIIIIKEKEKEMEKERASARCIFQLEYNLSNYMYR